MKKWMPWLHSFQRFSSKLSGVTMQPTSYVVMAWARFVTLFTSSPLSMRVMEMTFALSQRHLFVVAELWRAVSGM